MALQEHRKDGKLKSWKQFILGKRFYFPLSIGQEAAELWADALIAEAKRIKSKGGNEWTPEAEARAKAFALGEDAPVAKPEVQALKPISTGPTIHSEIKKFLAETETRISTNEIGHDQYQSLKSRYNIIQNWQKEDGTPVLPDLLLKQFGRDELKSVVDFFRSRPISPLTGKKIKPFYVVSLVGAIGQFMRWLYNTEKWDAFRAWEETLKVDADSLTTEKERHQKKNARTHYTIEELTEIYAAANHRQRLYILLALNCGMGSKEQATLKTYHLFLNPPTPYIDRERNKTGVKAKWTLWEETAKLLRIATTLTNANREEYHERMRVNIPEKWKDSGNKYRNRSLSAEESQKIGDIFLDNGRYDEDLALLTEDGYPLVHRAEEGENARTDAVYLSWKRLLNKLQKDGKKIGLTEFYGLRRTGAQLIRELEGYETHKVYLAHSSLEVSGKQSVAEKHYTARTQADFDKVEIALNKMREKLRPMFDAAIKADEEKEKADKKKPKKSTNKKRAA